MKELNYTQADAFNGLGLYGKYRTSSNPKARFAALKKLKNRKRNKISRKARRG